MERSVWRLATPVVRGGACCQLVRGCSAPACHAVLPYGNIRGPQHRNAIQTSHDPSIPPHVRQRALATAACHRPTRATNTPPGERTTSGANRFSKLFSPAGCGP